MGDGDHPRLRDITRIIEPGMSLYPGDPPVEVEATAKVETDGFTVHRLALGSHTGTHMDAPRHFVAEGRSIDEVPVERFLSSCLVVDAGDAPVIGLALVQAAGLAPGQSILFKTRVSRILLQGQVPEPEDIAPLSPDAAACLVRQGVNLVGTDGLSVDAFDSEDFAVHRILCGADVLILEDLLLAGVPAGLYRLLCAPLKIRGLDAAPVRAVLVEEQETRRSWPCLRNP